MLLLVACLFALAGWCSGTPSKYEGHVVVRVNLTGGDLDAALARLGDTRMDVWSQTPSHADVMLPRAALPLLPSGHVAVVVADLQAAIEEERLRLSRRGTWGGVGTRDGFFDSFRPYEEFVQYMETLVATFPSLVSLYSAGKTYEGRDIIALKISTGGTKPAIFIEGTVHAREWLAPTTSLFFAAHVLEKYQQGDVEAKRLVEQIEWHVIPIANADGYIYSWSRDRLWRKNRRQNVGTNTYGVDLNRNFGPNSTWCTSGSSRLPTSDTYCGTSAFSEPESQSTSRAYESVKGLAAVVAFHCYGPLLLRPFQYSYDQPPEPYATEVSALGDRMEKAINGVHGASYESIQGSSLYPHSGGTIDWAYLSFDIPAFTIEIRGNSFIVPDSEIILAGEENYAGLVVLADHTLAA